MGDTNDADGGGNAREGDILESIKREEERVNRGIRMQSGTRGAL